MVAGGVSANAALRARLHEMTQRNNAQVFYPRLEFCTDNGAMIAFVGSLRLKAGAHDPPTFDTRARWAIQDLPPI